MRLSRYISAIPLDDGKNVILYNPINETVIVSDKHEYRKIENISEDISCNRIAASEFQTLKEEGFLVSGSNEELESAKKKLDGLRKHDNSLNVTFLPTYACNMACTYCFERNLGVASTMSDLTLESSVSWISKKIDETKPERLNVLLFGGEPLLPKKQVFSFLRKISDKAVSCGIPLKTDLITNGTLLDAATVLQLKEWGLSEIKVTLDGFEGYHDKKRRFKNGSGTFDIIHKNLIDIHRFCRIAIGINYDAENENGIIPLVDFLKNSPVKESIASISVKPVMTDGSQGSPEKNLSCSQTVKEFEPSVKYIRYIRKSGFSVFDRVHLGPCEANCFNSFTIDPLGDIYLCPASIGHNDLKIGSVFSEALDEKYRSFLDATAFESEECSECVYLPMCYGGCRLISFFKTKDFRKVNCDREYFEKISPTLLKLEFEEDTNNQS